MYKYDRILMGNEVEAMNFLMNDCGMNSEYALKFLKKYWQKKEYESLALSMETDVTIVEDDLKAMTYELDEILNERASIKR